VTNRMARRHMTESSQERNPEGERKTDAPAKPGQPFRKGAEIWTFATVPATLPLEWRGYVKLRRTATSPELHLQKAMAARSARTRRQNTPECSGDGPTQAMLLRQLYWLILPKA